MNGIFNSGLQFWQLVTAIVLLVFSVIAIKITFTFDINKYLADRKKAFIPKLQNACTHISFSKTNEGKLVANSYFISPPGTLQWQCQRCRVITDQQGGDFDHEVEYFVSHPDIYKKREKRFSKLLKKSGMV